MSTNDVPGARAENRDKLAMGCWAEHADGSLIFVNSVEGKTVVYSIFDVGVDPPVEYRDAMAQKGFEKQFSYDPKKAKSDQEQWTWHDKTPFPWERVMGDFPSGQLSTSAMATMTAAERVAQSLNLRAEKVRERHALQPTEQRAATTIMRRIRDAMNVGIAEAGDEEVDAAGGD